MASFPTGSGAASSANTALNQPTPILSQGVWTTLLNHLHQFTDGASFALLTSLNNTIVESTRHIWQQLFMMQNQDLLKEQPGMPLPTRYKAVYCQFKNLKIICRYISSYSLDSPAWLKGAVKKNYAALVDYMAVLNPDTLQVEDLHNRSYQRIHILMREAIGCGSDEVVKVLLKKGIDLKQQYRFYITSNDSYLDDGKGLLRDDQTCTALMLAAHYGKASVMQVLLESGARLEETDAQRRTALMYAVVPSLDGEKTDHHCVKLLIHAKANTRAVDAKGISLIHYAAWHGRAESLRLLLGSDQSHLDVPNPLSLQTPLMLAARQGHVAALRVLCDFKANVHAFDHSGYTASTLAADRGNQEMIEVLLENKASLDVPLSDGVLIHAIFTGHVNKQCIQYLVAQGANIEKPSALRRAACMRPSLENCVWGRLSPQQMTTHQLWQLLLELGANMNAADLEGKTILMEGIDNPEFVRMLLDTCIDAPAKSALVNTKDSTGTTPLMHAVKRRNLAVVRMLKAAGADLKATDKKGWTALRYASCLGPETIAEELHGGYYPISFSTILKQVIIPTLSYIFQVACVMGLVYLVATRILRKRAAIC